MKGNLSEAMPAPLPSKGEANGCELASDNLRDVGQQKEITSRSLSVEEPTSTVWTDEKHSLYLNSMEASFINQLYNHDCFSMDFLGGNSKKINPTYKGHHSSRRISSGQFKVFRDNCWKVLNFERNRPELRIVEESQVFLGSPWVRHFRSAHKSQDTKYLHQKEKVELGIDAIHLRRRRKHYYELAGNSKRPLDCHSHHFGQDSVGNNAEVSDQNFVNEEPEEEKSEQYVQGKKHEHGGG